MLICGVTSLYVFMFYPLIILFIKQWGTAVTHSINSNYHAFFIYIFLLLIILYIKQWGTIVTLCINSHCQDNQFCMYICF